MGFKDVDTEKNIYEGPKQEHENSEGVLSQSLINEKNTQSSTLYRSLVPSLFISLFVSFFFITLLQQQSLLRHCSTFGTSFLSFFPEHNSIPLFAEVHPVLDFVISQLNLEEGEKVNEHGKFWAPKLPALLSTLIGHTKTPPLASFHLFLSFSPTMCHGISALRVSLETNLNFALAEPRKLLEEEEEGALCAVISPFAQNKSF